MSIKIAHPLAQLDHARLASLLTPQLLNPIAEDSARAQTQPVKPGTGWLMWAELVKTTDSHGN